ncbi:MAG: cytochrome c family protein [Planctomycetia bacterium]|nr:cytochrome c family protein [Planctomycetia bacterium]
MPQIFPKAINPIAKMLVLGFPLLAGLTGVTGAAFYRSSYATGVDETPPQPVAFSHAHHVGQLGIHCVYCHTSVETSGFANVPPTKTCMNCHQQIWQGADLLEPVRESYKTDKPIEWNRVHNLPHYAYFNHSIHVNKGVGCVSCHGRLDQMNLTGQASTLLMEWCIACHREPEKHLRPKEEIFNMTWTPAQKTIDPKDGQPYPTNQKELGLLLKERYRVRDAVTLTNCSMCHR